jgi:hypothetical protein
MSRSHVLLAHSCTLFPADSDQSQPERVRYLSTSGYSYTHFPIATPTLTCLHNLGQHDEASLVGSSTVKY